MGKYQSYSDYANPGTDWLGEIPFHWKAKRLGALFNRKKETGFTDEELLSVYRDYGVITKASREDNFNKPSDDLSPYQLVEPGDLVLNKMKTWQGSIAVSEHRGIVSPAYFTYRPGKHLYGTVLCPKYVHYLVRSPLYIAQYLRLSKGIRVNQWDLDPDTFKTLELVIPPHDEQETVAAFLDHETAKIDRLIAKQERLIDLLKEKRQAVISYAVTKGLNPDAPMKDSGVEWLGEVPAHWDVARVKFVAKLESGHTPSKQVEEYWVDCDIPWVSLNDSKQLAQVDYISDTAYQINDKGLAGSSARLLPPGAVVFTRDATIGLTAITTREMAVSQHLIAWLPRNRITPLFLLRVFNAMKAELDRSTFGATIKTIGMDDVKALTTTVPPLDEQEAICQYIDDRLSKFDLLTEKAERQINLLREHRVSLISSAVTGKIDVRGWQKPDNESEEAATAASA